MEILVMRLEIIMKAEMIKIREINFHVVVNVMNVVVLVIYVLIVEI